MKREIIHVIYLQETHLSQQEHSKIGLFGYKNAVSEKTFLKSVFEIIVLENEGTLIWAGDFNMILNPKLDTTTAKRNKL